MFRGIVLTSLVALALAALPRTAAAQQIATVVQVAGNAQLSLGGSRFTFASGTRIEQGSVISTAANSTVELTFDDGTNMVVGPNSSLEITEILMTSGSRADRFAVNAVAGSFRFISGNSSPETSPAGPQGSGPYAEPSSSSFVYASTGNRCFP